MYSYLYIVVVASILTYTIIRDILMFKKGKYYPYILKRSKGEMPLIARLVILLFIYIGGAVFIIDTKILQLMLFVFITYSICLVVSVSVMNYLSNLKLKDDKIIIQTIIFDIIIICTTTAIWRFIVD